MSKEIISFFIGFMLVIPVITGTLSCSNWEEKQKILLVTGGHSFEHVPFYDIFFDQDKFTVDTLGQPLANRALLSDTIGKYDVIVFYDMWQDISQREKEGFLRLTDEGKGLVFMHHSLASYQQWELFEEIRGGKYYERGYDYPLDKLSGYRHDIVLHVSVEDTEHPVTRGMGDFEILDEGYINIGVLPGVSKLLTTNHPDCSEIVGWAHNYNNSKVVYILLGHDHNAYSNENFRTLVYNAIEWTAPRQP